jgi:hypothetical protein
MNKTDLISKLLWLGYTSAEEGKEKRKEAVSMAHNLVDEYLEAINYTRCCESVKDKYTHTFEVDLNSEKRKEQYNKHIEQIHNAPCKVYLYDGDKYIELKP